MDDKTLALNLRLSDANLILEALGAMPYARVAQLVQNITKQAQEQLRQPEQAANE